MENNSKFTQFKGVFMLLLTALVWGSSFVAQGIGIESVDAFTFIGIRTLLGSVVLIPVFLIRDIIEVKRAGLPLKSLKSKVDVKAIKYGAILGVILCVATNFQQFAFYYSTPGKIAFITATYMFYIPIVSLFLKKKIPFITWICVVLAFVGLYFLCFKRGDLLSGKMNKGDILAMICAVFFTAHILVIEKFSPQCDGIKLSCMQFFVAGLISTILMFIFEQPQCSSIKKAAIPILYSGIMSCGVAYTFQVLGQKYVSAPVASLLMSMESVFAVLAAAIIINEKLSGREILGCAIMFAAIMISQVADIIIDVKKRKK